jgi:hypothetical protein
MRGYFHKVWTIGAVFATSVNHWRKPEYGFRHDMDVCTVFAVGTYNVYRQPKIWGVVCPLCLCIWRLSIKYNSHFIHSFIHVIPVSVYLLEDYIGIE